MRALITGVSGYIGRHLSHRLLAEGATVYGLTRAPERVRAFPAHPGLTLLAGDHADSSFLTAAVRQLMPTHVFHLAGTLGSAPGGYQVQYDANVGLTIALLESLLALDELPRVFIMSSSAVYGNPARMPITEETAFKPLSHYATSKAAQELVAIHYYGAHGLPIVRVRTFNLIGPGNSTALLPSDVGRQVVRAERSGRGVLRVGNLAPRRDYTDVRDAVSAYVLLARTGLPGEVYNVCSGQSFSVRECLDLFLKMSRAPLELEVEPARQRSIEIANQVGSAARLHALNGWAPMISLEASIADLLDELRGRPD